MSKTRVRAVWLTDYLSPGSQLHECSTGYNFRPGSGPVRAADSDQTREPAVAPGKHYSLKFIPAYLQLSFRPWTGYTLRTYPTLKGFAIRMDEHDSMDHFMQSHFKKGVRGNIMRCVRRLEKCYEVRYERIFGQIPVERYQRLMDLLKQMIISRFLERKQQSDTLKKWPEISARLLEDIRAHRASLYIVHHGTEPIAISVAYHYESIFFYYITSYDTDYSKFSLGNIVLYKQLEWCFGERFRYFEMGWGELDYKRRWSNYRYTYRNHEFFPSTSLISWSIALFDELITRLKAYLIRKRVNVFYRKWKQRLLWPAEAEAGGPVVAPQDLRKGGREMSGKRLEPGSPIYAVLKSALNDFLYATEEQFKDTGIYMLDSDSYMILGKSHHQEVTVSGAGS